MRKLRLWYWAGSFCRSTHAAELLPAPHEVKPAPQPSVASWHEPFLHSWRLLHVVPEPVQLDGCDQAGERKGEERPGVTEPVDHAAEEEHASEPANDDDHERLEREPERTQLRRQHD